MGKILGAFGVRGWVKAQSYTCPPENLLRYSPWQIGDKPYRVQAGQAHGKVFIAQLQGLTQRDQAAALKSKIIVVPREQFAPAKPGEYYWADLVGLQVRTIEGLLLGRIVGLVETGANDVMEVEGERDRMIPFAMGEYVKEVRLDEGFMIVDWDPDF